MWVHFLDINFKEGCPLSSKTYYHLIGLAEIYLSEHDHQIASKTIFDGFQIVTPRHTMWWPNILKATSYGVNYPMSALLVGFLEKWQNQMAFVKRSFDLYPPWHN